MKEENMHNILFKLEVFVTWYVHFSETELQSQEGEREAETNGFDLSLEYKIVEKTSKL